MSRLHKPTEVLELTDAFVDSHCPPGRRSSYHVDYPPVHLTPDEAADLYDFVHTAPVDLWADTGRLPSYMRRGRGGPA
jgi:hypothetical protein